jgi:high-affinity Fe2+/Pb2+ permease
LQALLRTSSLEDPDRPDRDHRPFSPSVTIPNVALKGVVLRERPEVRRVPLRVLAAVLVVTATAGLFISIGEAWRGGGFAMVVSTILIPLVILGLIVLGTAWPRRDEHEDRLRRAVAALILITVWGSPCLGVDRSKSTPSGVEGLIPAATRGLLAVGLISWGVWAFGQRRAWTPRGVLDLTEAGCGADRLG